MLQLLSPDSILARFYKGQRVLHVLFLNSVKVIAVSEGHLRSFLKEGGCACSIDNFLLPLEYSKNLLQLLAEPRQPHLTHIRIVRVYGLGDDGILIRLLHSSQWIRSIALIDCQIEGNFALALISYLIDRDIIEMLDLSNNQLFSAPDVTNLMMSFLRDSVNLICLALRNVSNDTSILQRLCEAMVSNQSGRKIESLDLSGNNIHAESLATLLKSQVLVFICQDWTVTREAILSRVPIFESIRQGVSYLALGFVNEMRNSAVIKSIEDMITRSSFIKLHFQNIRLNSNIFAFPDCIESIRLIRCSLEVDVLDGLFIQLSTLRNLQELELTQATFSTAMVSSLIQILRHNVIKTMLFSSIDLSQDECLGFKGFFGELLVNESLENLDFGQMTFKEWIVKDLKNVLSYNSTLTRIGWRMENGGSKAHLKAIKTLMECAFHILHFDLTGVHGTKDEFEEILGIAMDREVLLSCPLLEDMMSKFEAADTVRDLLWTNSERITKQVRISVYEGAKRLISHIRADVVFEQEIVKLICKFLNLPVRSL
jgi:hypothetical protein